MTLSTDRCGYSAHIVNWLVEVVPMALDFMTVLAFILLMFQKIVRDFIPAFGGAIRLPSFCTG